MAILTLESVDLLYDLEVHGHQQLRSLISCSWSWIILPMLPMQNNRSRLK